MKYALHGVIGLILLMGVNQGISAKIHSALRAVQPFFAVLDSAGNMLTNVRFEPGASFCAAEVTSTGSVLLVRDRWDVESFCIADLSGNILRRCDYQPAGRMAARDECISACRVDGGYALFGTSSWSESGTMRIDSAVFWVLGVAENGDSLWSSVLPWTSLRDWYSNIQPLPNGGVRLIKKVGHRREEADEVQFTCVYPNGSHRTVPGLQLDSNYQKLWDVDVQPTADGGLLLAVASQQIETRHLFQTRLYWVDVEGNIIRERGCEPFSGGKKWIHGWQTTADGNYLLTGFDATNDENAQLFLAKMDPDGSLLWSRTYKEFPRPCYAFAETPAHNFVLIGDRNQGSDEEPGIKQVMTVDSTGQIIAVKHFDLPASVRDIHCLPDGRMVAAGYWYLQNADTTKK